MSNSPYLYLAEPKLYQCTAKIISLEPGNDGLLAIGTTQSVFRPAGGGQPSDCGSLTISDEDVQIVQAIKRAGKTIHIVKAPDLPLVKGQVIEVKIDAARRDALSKLHTVQHLASAALNSIKPSASVEETNICDKEMSAIVRVEEGQVAPVEWTEVAQSIAEMVAMSRPVRSKKARNLDSAKFEYGDMFRIKHGLNLSGKIRVIEIEDLDANPCSGTHWCSSDVGPIDIQAGGNEIKIFIQ